MPFLLGALAAWIAIFTALGFADERLYRAIVDNFDRIQGPKSAETRALGLLNLVHELVSTRFESLGNGHFDGLRDAFIPPANVDLLIGDGLCGSYTMVFTRLAKAAGYSVRIGQMICQGRAPGCHMFSEVLLDGRWVAMDAMFNFVIRNPDGSLATFDEISDDLLSLQAQFPADFKAKWFDYSGVERTNWNKVPILMPAVRKGVVWLTSEEAAAGFSARVYFLNWYFNAVYVALLLALVCWIFWFALTVVKRRHQ